MIIEEKFDVCHFHISAHKKQPIWFEDAIVD